MSCSASIIAEVDKIVRTKGEFREKDIWSVSPLTHMGETWNEYHKIVHVVSPFCDEDGYCPSFSVDLVTGFICG